MPGRITTYIEQITSGIRYLQRPGGRGLLGGITGVLDRVLADASDAQRERMIRECSDSALDCHARNSGDRRVLGETNPELRAYLEDRWNIYRLLGTEDGMRRQLARLHLAAEFWDYQRLKLSGVPSNVAFGGYAQRGYFFVIIRQPHPFIQGPIWDGGDTWDGGEYWGIGRSDGGDPGQLLDEIRFLLIKSRPGGHSPRFLVLDMDGSAQVQLIAPYDFTGNYLIYPLFERAELIGGSPTPFYSFSFVNP